MKDNEQPKPVHGFYAVDWLVRLVIPAYIAGGALLKFASGTTADLPPIMRYLPGTQDPGKLYQILLLVISAELVLAVLLALHQRWARPLAIFALTVFAGVLVHAIASGATSCGCLGSLRVSPWVMLAIDLALLVGATFLRRHAAVAEPSTARWLLMTVISGVFITMVFYGAAAGYQGRWSRSVVLDTHRWVGRNWDQLSIFNWTPRATDGRPASPATYPEDHQVWVFYRRTCPHCFQTIKSLADQPTGPKRRLVVVDLPYPAGFEERNNMSSFEPPCTDCTKLRADEGREYAADVPIVVTFERGVVVQVQIGDR